MRKEGVKDHHDLPGTVLSVREALALAFGSDPHDALNEKEVDETIRRINAENKRREDAREEWELAEIELHGVTLTPGSFYDVTERVGAYGRNLGSERTARNCQYRRRAGYMGDDDRVTYAFTRWGAKAAAQKPAMYGSSGQSDSWTARGIVALTPVEANANLLEHARWSKMSLDERTAYRKKLIEERDKLADTTKAEA